MLKLIQYEWGQFDIALVTPTEDALNAEIKTIVYAALFTDQRAAEGRVEDPFDQRGWFYDPARGSGLWYVRRQALSQGARVETANMVRRAIEQMDGMTEVVVDQAAASALGNISRVELEIGGRYHGRRFVVSGLDPNAVSMSGISVWTEPWDEPWSD